MRFLICLVAAGLALLAVFPPVCTSQDRSDYVIGPEDVLSLTVWDHKELSGTFVVRGDGTITVPPLGEIPASGKTTTELARDLEARIYSILRLTAQSTVQVSAFNSQKIYLAGQVSTPGRYSFEQIPGLIDLLGAAGGLNTNADLSNVRILRKTTGTPETISIDVAHAMQTGDMSALPPLRAGDVIYVPALATAGGAEVPTSNGVYVMGEVPRPGTYAITKGMDLVQVLSLAGGVTPTGDLARVSVLGTDPGGGSFLLRIDLKKEIASGRRGIELRPGDRVFVATHKPSAGELAWTGFTGALSISRDLLNIVVIGDYLNHGHL